MKKKFFLIIPLIITTSTTFFMASNESLEEQLAGIKKKETEVSAIQNSLWRQKIDLESALNNESQRPFRDETNKIEQSYNQLNWYDKFISGKGAALQKEKTSLHEDPKNRRAVKTLENKIKGISKEQETLRAQARKLETEQENLKQAIKEKWKSAPELYELRKPGPKEEMQRRYEHNLLFGEGSYHPVHSDRSEARAEIGRIVRGGIEKKYVDLAKRIRQPEIEAIEQGESIKPRSRFFRWLPSIIPQRTQKEQESRSTLRERLSGFFRGPLWWQRLRNNK
jgi:chromosome segregation ATPase